MQTGLLPALLLLLPVQVRPRPAPKGEGCAGPQAFHPSSRGAPSSCPLPGGMRASRGVAGRPPAQASASPSPHSMVYTLVSF